ncbi:MAG: hypothetical protein U0136_04750 [Bdellovibrionota bacterium]
MLADIPYYKLLPTLFHAEVAAFRGRALADQLLPQFVRTLELAARERAWAMFGSAQDSAVREDVMKFLHAFYALLIRAGDSGVNGYHPKGYLWRFSRDFADLIAAAPATGSKLFLCPGDFGPSFTGTPAVDVGHEGCVTPPLLGQAVRCPAMCMIGTRGALFTPFGKGGNTELACHREWMQVRGWSMSPFTGWPDDKLPRRFLIDSQTSGGWYFEAQRALVASWLEVKSLYSHDVADHGRHEMIIRVTGGTRETDESSYPVVEEFETYSAAAEFVFAHGA